MRRSFLPHLAIVATVSLLLTACGDGRSEVISTRAPVPPPAETMTSHASPTISETEQLPSVDNTDINRADPDEVAYEFIRLSTTFLPGDVFDPLGASERGYPLATPNYIEKQAPVSNPDVVQIGGWWNLGEDPDDPVQLVESEVELLHAPETAEHTPPVDTDERVTRYARSTQTPVTASGDTLDPRVQDATLTLVKQEDGGWLVDHALYEVINEG